MTQRFYPGRAGGGKPFAQNVSVFEANFGPLEGRARAIVAGTVDQRATAELSGLFLQGEGDPDFFPIRGEIAFSDFPPEPPRDCEFRDCPEPEPETESVTRNILLFPSVYGEQPFFGGENGYAAFLPVQARIHGGGKRPMTGAGILYWEEGEFRDGELYRNTTLELTVVGPDEGFEIAVGQFALPEFTPLRGERGRFMREFLETVPEGSE